jgi:hypothetical protein
VRAPEDAPDPVESTSDPGPSIQYVDVPESASLVGREELRELPELRVEPELPELRVLLPERVDVPRLPEELRGVADRVPELPRLLGVVDRVPLLPRLLGVVDRVPLLPRLLGVVDRVPELPRPCVSRSTRERSAGAELLRSASLVTPRAVDPVARPLSRASSREAPELRPIASRPFAPDAPRTASRDVPVRSVDLLPVAPPTSRTTSRLGVRGSLLSDPRPIPPRPSRIAPPFPTLLRPRPIVAPLGSHAPDRGRMTPG